MRNTLFAFILLVLIFIAIIFLNICILLNECSEKNKIEINEIIIEEQIDKNVIKEELSEKEVIIKKCENLCNLGLACINGKMYGCNDYNNDECLENNYIGKCQQNQKEVYSLICMFI